MLNSAVESHQINGLGIKEVGQQHRIFTFLRILSESLGPTLSLADRFCNDYFVVFILYVHCGSFEKTAVTDYVSRDNDTQRGTHFYYSCFHNSILFLVLKKIPKSSIQSDSSTVQRRKVTKSSSYNNNIIMFSQKIFIFYKIRTIITLK